MYDDILFFVQNLSEKICKIFNIPLPKIYILISRNGDFNGGMTPRRNKSKIFIDLVIPHNVTLEKHRAIITAITIHEHCHYYDSLQMTAKEREISMNIYMNDSNKRKVDEQRTWQCTKKIAKLLKVWTKDLYKEVKQCSYTSNITFK